MKEITRIHIAKIPYDIELSAKKALETYIEALGTYANDDELLQDIEVRITELLAERGVTKDDIIADTDVQAVRQQLGEPEAFMSDDGPAITAPDEPSRRLYRNQETAVVGGVLSGIASFFRVNPLWIRLIFIVVFFLSYGTALLVYIVLWLAVPPARTAAEKLRMSGRPVTLAAIREISEQDATSRPVVERRVRRMKRAATIIAGLLCLVVATIAMVAVVSVTWALIAHRGTGLDGLDIYQVIAVSLGVLSGLLLVTLALMGAYAAFARKVTKAQIIAAVVVIVVGLGSFGTAIGVVGYQGWQRSDLTQRNTRETTIPLQNFATVKTLKVIAPGVMTQYVIDDTPRMVLTSLPNYKASYTVNGDSATVSVKQQHPTDARFGYAQPVLTIYGPALGQLDVGSGQVSYQAEAQPTLHIRILHEVTLSFAGDNVVNISGGTIGKLSIESASNQSVSINAEDASVRDVEAQLNVSDTLQLGKINTLTVSYPDVCPAGSQSTTVSVGALIATTMTVNQKTVASQSTDSLCGSVEILPRDETTYGAQR